MRGCLGLEICSTIGGLGSSGSSAADSGGFDVPSGRSITASVTLPARSATDIRTFNASAVPASHPCEPISFGRGIGTRRHTPTPSTWYSSTSDLRSRYSSLTSQRTVARLPRRPSGSSSSEGATVSTTTFKFGSTVASSLGETWPSTVSVWTANQYSPSWDERKLNVGWSGNVLLTARHLCPEFSETSRITSLMRFRVAVGKVIGIRKLRPL